MKMAARSRLALGAAIALALALALAPGVAMAGQGSETVWANGQAWTMLTPHVITNPSPNLLAKAPPLYILAFPQDPVTHQFILPADYAPQCDPCLGVPVPPYHDHLLTGAPGFGTNGTAGDYMSPWRPTLMIWNPVYVRGGHFKPVTSDEQLPAAIAAGEFLPIGGPGVFEKPLPVVLICPLVSPAAAG